MSILQSPQGLELGGEEREVTILMSDLRGFTALAARLTPHEVIEFLNLYLEAMVDVISRFEGTIDEIIGDAILVSFGAPLACDDHAAKAVACGLAMQLAMADLNRRLTAKGAAALEMGIGINTGRVIVGNSQLQIDLKPHTAMESASLLKESPSEYKTAKKRAPVARKKF